MTAANVHIYVGGIEVAYSQTTNGANPVDNSTYSFNIGARNVGSYLLEGLMDFAYVYNRELSAADALYLHYEPFAMFDQRRIWAVAPSGHVPYFLLIRRA